MWVMLPKRGLLRCGSIWTHDPLLDRCVYMCVCVCVLLLLFLNLQCILGVDIDSNFFFFGFLIYVNQGVLAQRRSNFQGNGFPFAAEAARRAAVAPFRVRASNARRVANLNKPRYMDFC